MSSVVFLGALSAWVYNWLTPIWLLGVGALGGLLLLLVLWAVLWLVSRLSPAETVDLDGWTARNRPAANSNWLLAPIRRLVSRRFAAEIPLAVREGVLWWLFLVSVVFAGFGIFGALLVQEPLTVLDSLRRLPFVGTSKTTFEIPVSAPDKPGDEFAEPVPFELPVEINYSEIRSLTFRSDQELTIAARPFVDVKPGASLDVPAGEDAQWVKGVQVTNPMIDSDVSKLFIRNLGSKAAKLELTTVTSPPNPEVITVPITAISLAALFLLYLLQHAISPRLSAIALATYKSEVAQPLFAIVLILGFVLLFLFVFIPYNTFGEDIKVLKDSGLTLIMILGIVQAVWAAGTSVAEEIEGRTALTVLSKPIGRRSFILGKFVGICWTVALLFIVLGLALLIAVAYKPIYDSKEASTSDLTWQLCHLEMVFTVPGLLLAFMEAVVLTAISVAISTRLPLLANFVITFAIYLLGNLTPLIVQSSMGQLVFVQFFGQLIATVFPNLEHFNIQAAVAAGLPVPSLYLGWALVYCLVYSLIAMLLAWFLFDDRDLA